MEETRSLRPNEQRILKCLIEDRGCSFRDIARKIGLNDVSVRRIHNRMLQDSVFYPLNIPNFPLLGYGIMMEQRIHVASPHLIAVRRIIDDLMSEWGNCIDCHETYDGKIIARSVWMAAEDFKEAHAGFYRKFGTDWLQAEEIDMITLDCGQELFRINPLF